MTLFKWTEIKKWANSHDLKPTKTGAEYKFEDNVYNDLKDLIFALYNKITNNKFLEHQKTYAENSAK